MIFSCKHDWVLCFEFYAPPLAITKIALPCGEGADALVHGATTLYWECSKCTAAKKERFVGKKVDCAVHEGDS